MKILYFAWLRQKIGTGAEEIDPPEGVEDVRGLVDWLVGRGGGYAEAFQDRDAIKLAVNQEFADMDARIAEGDEVAFFPPVTGG